MPCPHHRPPACRRLFGEFVWRFALPDGTALPYHRFKRGDTVILAQQQQQQGRGRAAGSSSGEESDGGTSNELPAPLEGTVLEVQRQVLLVTLSKAAADELGVAQSGPCTTLLDGRFLAGGWRAARLFVLACSPALLACAPACAHTPARHAPCLLQVRCGGWTRAPAPSPRSASWRPWPSWTSCRMMPAWEQRRCGPSCWARPRQSGWRRGPRPGRSRRAGGRRRSSSCRRCSSSTAPSERRSPMPSHAPSPSGRWVPCRAPQLSWCHACCNWAPLRGCDRS